MGKKPRTDMIVLPTGDIMEEDKTDDTTTAFDISAMDMLVIKEHLNNYPDINTVEDLFHAMKIPHKQQTDFVLAKFLREILIYPVVEVEEEIPREVLDDIFVQIPAKGLYAKLNIEDEHYQLVYQIGFLRADQYIPGKSEGMLMLPFLGKKLVDTREAEGVNGEAAWLVTTTTIKNHENLDQLKKFLVFKGNTEKFICGNTIYSLNKGNLGQHGEVTASNLNTL